MNHIKKAVAAAFKQGMFQHEAEVMDFCEWLLQRERELGTVVEIGSHRGGTSELFLSLGARVISVDLPEGRWGGLSLEESNKRTQALTARHGNRFTAILANSHFESTVTSVRQAMGCMADLLFIDGDHSMMGVMSDFFMYKGLVKPGGYVAFHDINPTQFHKTQDVEVPVFWQALLPAYSHWEFTVGADWGGIGVIQL